MLIDHFHWVGVILEPLRHLLTVFGKDDAVRNHVLKRIRIEKPGCEHLQIVEPRTKLTRIFRDKLRRKSFLETLLVLERVVHLTVRHRARIEPCIENVRNSLHGAAAFAEHRDRIDDMHMQVVDFFSARRFQFRDATKYLLRFAFLAHPDRNDTGPKPLARDRPIARTFKPLSKKTFFDVSG